MTPELDLTAVMPLLLVGGGAILLPLFEVLLARMIRHRRTWLSRPMTRELAGTGLSIASAGILAFALLSTLGGFDYPARAFNVGHPTIALDGVTHFLNATILIAAIFTVLVSNRYLAALGANHGEYYALVLSSVLGMMLLTSATDLIVLFLALELMSIPIYALAGFRRETLRSNESALKYFVIGGFASGVLLYGFALLYGATGSVALAEIALRFDPESPLALIGAGLTLVGLGFKIASAPFHQWAPDVYEGAPTTVTAFMATAVKVAAFGALMRVLGLAFGASAEVIYWVIWCMAVLSMTVGNVMAIIQQNTKRMLAYSSIAHAGYALVGICAGPHGAEAGAMGGYSAVMFYLLVYTFMTIGAFTAIAALARDGHEPDRIDDLAGLAASRPLPAAVMTVCMLGLAGIPVTGGFMAKFQLFRAAVARGTAVDDASLIVLAVALALNTAVSLAYYLRVPVVMYMREPEAGAPELSVGSTPQRLVLLACAAAVLLLGVAPHDVFVVFGDVDLFDWARIAGAPFGS